MVIGIEKFIEYLKGYESQYAIIGGTACDLLMADENLSFRATKDIDMVLIVEALSPDFGKCFWQFICDAEYEHINKSTGKSQFYRFSKPKSHDCPYMIELFSRKLDFLKIPEDSVIEPIPIDDEISSLSAIILDETYYEFLKEGRVLTSSGIPVLDPLHLIPFKAKAWLDLSSRKANGESIDGRNIRKHKNDIFILEELLTPYTTIRLPREIKHDMNCFLEAMMNEEIDRKHILKGRDTKESIINGLKETYHLL